ncbi:hypothetical protein O0L34_g13967 [Tuta absoluta]|nr:hypothetical protein O0L34_g13967 [Tuta absoluta]
MIKNARSKHNSADDFIEIYNENGQLNKINYVKEYNEKQIIARPVTHTCLDDYKDIYKINSDDVGETPQINPYAYNDNTIDYLAYLSQENCDLKNMQYDENVTKDTTKIKPYANNHFDHFNDMYEENLYLNNRIDGNKNIEGAVIHPYAYSFVDFYRDNGDFSYIKSNDGNEYIKELKTTDDLKEDAALKTKLLSLAEVKDVLHKTQFENVVENLKKTRPQEKDPGKVLTKEEKEHINYALLCRVYQLNLPGRESSNMTDLEKPRMPSYLKPKQSPKQIRGTRHANRPEMHARDFGDNFKQYD